MGGDWWVEEAAAIGRILNGPPFENQVLFEFCLSFNRQFQETL